MTLERLRWDVPGALLIGLAAVWAVVSESRAGGDAGPFVSLLAAASTTLFVARAASAWQWWIAPVAVVAAAAAVAAANPDTLLESPLRNPLDYANATAALYVQAAAAALLLAAGASNLALKAIAVVGAGMAAAVPWANGSEAAAILVAILPLTLLGAIGRRAARAVVLVSATAVLAAVAGTVILGLSPDSGGRLADALTDRRVTLWHEAIELIEEDPLTGVGPGRFPEESPTARRDRDAAWAHAELLQVGAETGLPGMLAVAAVLGWAFALLFRSGDAIAAVAAGALGAFGVHAAIDYVGHFPAVVVALAAVVGAGSTHRSRRGDPAAVSEPEAPAIAQSPRSP